MNKNSILAGYEDVLLPKDIAGILHVGKSTVYRLLEEEQIKSIKIGKIYRIPKMYLIEYMYSSDCLRKNKW